MGFYIGLYIAALLPTLLLSDKRGMKVSFIVLWVVYAFRDNVAVDDGGYIRAFDYINKGWGYDIEITYSLLSKLAYSLGMNYKFVFFVYASMSFVFLYKAVEMLYEYKQDKLLYLIAFLGTVFFTSISVMRQWLAACICFFAVVYMYRTKKKLIPILLCIAAISIHTGALIGIPFLLVSGVDTNKLKPEMRIVIVLTCAVLGYSNITSYLVEKLIFFLPVSWQIYAGRYSGSFSSAGGTLSLVLLALYIIQNVIEVSFSKRHIYGLDVDTLEVSTTSIMETGQLVYLALLFLFVHAGVASRIALTFMPFVATLPYTFSIKFSPKDRNVILFITFLGMFALYMMTLNNVSSGNSGYFIPYNASWDFFES